ncbi:Secretion protein HlyD [Vibrio chagasii]|nr:Secretion protein HlyD [Vibrio chagasii]
MLSKSNNLYRNDFLESKNNHNQGTIITNPSLSQNVFLVLSILVLLSILSFLVFAEYTRRETLSGVVSPIGGMVKVKSNKSGYISKLFVKEGVKVKKLSPLYEVKYERFDSSGVGLQEKISISIDSKYKLIKDRKVQESQKSNMEFQSYTKEINNLDSEIKILENVLSLSNKEIELSENLLLRQGKLLENNYLSEIDYQKQKLDLISKEYKLENNNLNLQKLLRERENLLDRRKSVKLNLEIKLKDLDRQLEDTEREKVEYLYQSDSQVRSPLEGTITSILTEKGHSVKDGQVVLTIAPESTETFVELYASSRDIGFIRLGQNVKLRFDAYPYEKFGVQSGVVKSIAKSAVAPELIENRRLIRKEDIGGLYQIQVQLTKPTITIYGKEEELISGMTVSADVEIDTRNIYEWILEPFYSIKGKI